MNDSYGKEATGEDNKGRWQVLGNPGTESQFFLHRNRFYITGVCNLFNSRNVFDKKSVLSWSALKLRMHASIFSGIVTREPL